MVEHGGPAMPPTSGASHIRAVAHVPALRGKITVMQKELFSFIVLIPEGRYNCIHVHIKPTTININCGRAARRRWCRTSRTAYK